MGVEEEYLLLDPATAALVPLADEVRAVAGPRDSVEANEVQSELLQSQLEIATPVCTDLAAVGAHLLRLRDAVAVAAEKAGCVPAATGTPPLACAAPVAITEQPRYAAVASLGGRLADEQLINGMHVHIGVPDRDMGVAVLNRVRHWLPVLVAMGGNSPLWWGRDTGYASWRTVVFGRWPVSGPPPRFDGRADYERRVDALLESGAVMDSGQLYWQARLSERYPTVEVRCLDVQLTADDAMMFAGIVRGLVATAIRDARSGHPAPDRAPEILDAATWQAARYGLGAELLDTRGRRSTAADAVRVLLDHIAPGLDETGDTHEVARLVRRFLRRGTPAERQRRALASGGLEDWTALVSARS